MSRRGVTLLEALVALAATALLLGALSRGLAGAARAGAGASAGADRLSAARTVLLRLAAEIEAAVPETGVEVEPDAEREPAGARLRLTTVARVAPGARPAGDRRALVYEVDRKTSTLVRRERLAPAAAEAPPPTPLPVLAGVHRLAVRCSDGEDWQPRWRAGTLPRAVTVALAIDDGAGGIEELTTTVAPALGGR